MNLTLFINVSATLCLASAVGLIREAPFASLGLAYASGMLTAFASYYSTVIHRSP